MGMTLFRAVLVVAWLLIFYLSVEAARWIGVMPSFDIFIGDFSNWWRAQFHTDFVIHLVLVASWLLYRTKNWIVGLLLALLAINLGSLFTVAYVFALTFTTKGDVRALLLGDRA